MSFWERLFRGSRTEHEEAARPALDGPEHRAPQKLSGRSAEDFLRGHRSVVVDLWAAWYQPCRAFAPVVDRAAAEFAGRVAFGKVNVDRDPSLARLWKVRSVPTLLFFRDGKVVGRVTGPCSPASLDARIRRAFGL